MESATAKYKYRVVLQGSNVKDDGGNNVYFNDTASAPTNMSCIRSVIAYGHLTGGEVSQADAEQAFIQPLLADDIHMYIFIPPDMWSDKMRMLSKGIINPVFRLRRPLYGWSRSGNIWESHLAESLGQLGWKPVDGWSQTFTKIGRKYKPVILTVYVDDFIMSGPGSWDEWPAIRKLVRTTVPTEVGRVLGVHHNFSKKGTVTYTDIDMIDYVGQAVGLYNSTKGSSDWPLRPSVHYPWYEPTQHEIETLGIQPGIFGPNAASLLMKALYCARMVRMDICYSINTLSRYITKWNALCDKQLRHLYSYLGTASNIKLHAQMDSKDLDQVHLETYPDADLAGNIRRIR